MDRGLPPVHSPPHPGPHRLYDVHRVRDGDRHQHEQRRAALAVERQARPAREAEPGQEDRDHHHDDRHDPPERAQHDCRDDQHRPESDRPENAHILVERVADGAVEEEFAGKVVFDRRMLRPLRRGGGAERVDDFGLGRLPVFVGKRHADDQRGNAAVAGNEAPGNLLGPERDLARPPYRVIVERSGVVDQRADDQLVADAPAVGIVRDRIDAGDIGRLPEPFGQLLDGNQRFARENPAGLRRDGDERGIRYGVGVFQPLERDKVRVVLVEMIPEVDIDGNDELRARRKDRHQRQRKQDGQPPARHNQRRERVQIHRGLPNIRPVPTIASATCPGTGRFTAPRPPPARSRAAPRHRARPSPRRSACTPPRPPPAVRAPRRPAPRPTAGARRGRRARA